MESQIDPVCMECKHSGGVAYVELEGGDLLCGKCYAVTLQELADWGKSKPPKDATKKKKSKHQWLELKTYVEPDKEDD
jgi:hypothetical protein